MKTIEKQNYIYSHIHKVNEPALNELYNKVKSFLNQSLVEESEDDIKNGDLTSHADLKKEVQTWRITK